MMWRNCPTQRAYQHGVWNHLRHARDVQRVDAFVCSLPACGCVQWLPFNKSVLIVEGTSVNAGYVPGCLEAYAAIAHQPRHSFGYNNQFQVAGGDHTRSPLRHVRRWIPSFCGYNGEADAAAFDDGVVDVLVFTKSGSRISAWKEYLRPVDSGELQKALDKAEAARCRVSSKSRPCMRRRFRVRNLMDVLPHFELSRLTSGGDVKADVVVCTVFQMTYMSALELHRLNIPLYFPIPGAQYAAAHPDIMAADLLHLPSVGLFHNTADLASGIVAADLRSRHLRSKAFNGKFRDVLAEVWASRLRRMFPGVATGTHRTPRVPAELSVAQAWEEAVGLAWRPSDEEVPCEPPDSMFLVSPHHPG